MITAMLPGDSLRGYDSHFIVRELGRIVKNHPETIYKKRGGVWATETADMDVGVIPNNLEKYMAITLGKKLVFIDSF